MKLLTFFKNKYYRKAEMVKYWKTQDAIEAKVMRMKDGSYGMQMLGEKYIFPGYPRGSLLFGLLSKLKHEIKNQVFNDAWARLEKTESPSKVIENIRTVVWPRIFEVAKPLHYDQLPFEKLCSPMKELHRAMTVSGVDARIRDIICFILQEDDAYRMRFQWLVKFFPRFKKPTIADFHEALLMAEQAEIVGDMKERQRLFRRIFLLMVKDSIVFQKFIKEVNWSKIGLSKADKYFFRAKYFKVDYPEYQY